MIRFFSEGIAFDLKQKPKIRKWINGMILNEKKQPGTINYIFCSDEYLVHLNKTFLKHNTYTDILTFPDTEDPVNVSGDIFISIPRVVENSGKYRQTVDLELSRVMVHGILHLIGYKDKTKSEKIEMTAKEDHYLSVV